MSLNVFKFGSNDLIKFIEIYRNHECLWNTENQNYKSRDSRNAALVAFTQEFGVDGFGPKEITNKIKNLRTQYHAERKKIKDSMNAGSDDVYKSKLFWYSLMDSFLMKTSEHRETTSYMNDTSLEIEYFPDPIIQIDESPPSLDRVPEKPTKKTSGYIESSLNEVDNYEKRARLERKDDDLEYFGKYVASSLRILSTENSIHAQDEIQAILSKYKLRDLQGRQNSTSMP